MARVITRLEKGQGQTSDVDLLAEIAQNILGNTICPLGDAAAMPMIAFIAKFRDEFVKHAEQKRCPFGPYPVRPSHPGQEELPLC